MIELACGVAALLLLAGTGFPLGLSLLAVGSVGFALNHRLVDRVPRPGIVFPPNSRPLRPERGVSPRPDRGAA